MYFVQTVVLVYIFQTKKEEDAVGEDIELFCFLVLARLTFSAHPHSPVTPKERPSTDHMSSTSPSPVSCSVPTVSGHISSSFRMRTLLAQEADKEGAARAGVGSKKVGTYLENGSAGRTFLHRLMLIQSRHPVWGIIYVSCISAFFY